jgi:hypothetical protein
MKSALFRSLLPLFYLLLLYSTASCVSVSLKSEPFIKSKTLVIPSIKPPFRALQSNQGFDYTFRNKDTKSTIAVLSECSSKQRLSLDAVEADFAGILSSRQRKTSEKNRFGITPSQYSIFQGQLDGKNLIFALFVTSKLDCVYSFSLIADPDHFSKDLPTLESLIQNSKW